MAKIFTTIMLGLSLLLATAQNSFAVDSKVGSIDYYSYLTGDPRPEIPTSTTQKFYNAQGQLSYELGAYGLTTYSYNEAGLLSESVDYYLDYDLNIWVFSTKTSFEYDELNQLVRQNSLSEDGTVTGYTLYENYINGKYQDSKNMSADGSTIYYWQQFEYIFNGDVLESTIQKYKPSAEEDAVILGKIDFTYANDLLETESFSPYVSDSYDNTADGSYTKTYTYDAEGNLIADKNSSISRWGNYDDENVYNYNDYSADYLPTNVSIELVTGEEVAPNTVEITWDAAVSGDVTGYMVIVDELVDQVITGTSFTTTSLINGEHMFAVLPIVNGMPSTATDLISYNVNDEGVVPAENLSVISIGESDESGYYPVELTWDAPATNSVITGYRVYYSTWSYTDFTETSGTLSIPYWSAETTDENGDVIGVDLQLYVVAIYSTGFAEASDMVTVNVVDGTVTAIEDEVASVSVSVYPNPATDYLRFSEAVSVTVYSMSGAVVASSSALTNELNISELNDGVYIVETTSVNGYKTITKVIVK